MDFDLIVKKFGVDVETVNVYPLGDLHIGSTEFNLDNWNRWSKAVQADPNGVVILVGDMMDNGLKNSKTNSYAQTLQPFQQKKLLVELLEPISDKIVLSLQGNHEYRSVYLTDDCPLYDALARLWIEDTYRENFGFLKISLGKKNAERQFTYTLAVAHGKSKNKNEKFAYAIDGMDVFITGHTHQPASSFPAKIVIDPYNEVVKMRGYKHVSVPSFQNFGGYALRDMYMPQDGTVFPVITLNGTKKEVIVKWI